MAEVSQEQIIRTYNRLVDEHGGKRIGQRIFMRETGISPYYWQGGYWRNWSALVEAAGHTPNDPNEKIPDELVLSKFVSLALEMDAIPTEADLMIKRKSDSSYPSKATYRRWGNRATLIEKAISFCEENDDFADTLKIFNAGVSKSTKTRHISKDIKGFVYLLRSGKNYKIGRTNAIGRRLNELSIQLPLKPDTVHVIETDDPEGIEQYWHRRFTEKRQGGEWFSLTSEDVAAFKRRSFQ